LDEATTVLRLVGEKADVSVQVGYFRALDGNRVVVDVGGGRIPADVATAFRPEPNEPVTLLFVDGLPTMLGPAVPKAGQGLVESVDGDYAIISTDMGSVRAPYPEGLLVAPGDLVKLLWSDGPFVVAVMSTTPEKPPVPPAPGGGGVGDRQDTFTALQSGAFQSNGSRWSSDQPRASDGYLGAWHYGSKIADTIPANAAVRSVEIFVRYASRFGSPPNFGLHSQLSQAGAPDVFDAFPWPVNDGWNTVPEPHATTWFDALKAGGGKFGVVLNHGGVNRFLSTGDDPQSGALRISYTA
jgi:hypothetical protein